MTTNTHIPEMASLFAGPASSGGNKYEAVRDGLYRGRLNRVEEGPTFYDTKEISEAYPQGKPQPKVRWVWDLFTADGREVLDSTTGKQQEISELTSTATGERSFAAAFFSAHLGKTYDNRVTTREEAVQGSIGKMVLLSVSTKPSGYRKVAVFAVNE